MKKIAKQILLFYLIIVFLKILISSFIPTPIAFSDEYIYMKLARSFFFDFNFSVHGNLVNIYPPLYPVLLSISYLFNDITVVYFLMKVINALISSLIIIPSFLLAKEFLNEKKSLIISILVSIIPSSFSFSSHIMSENLFYPLSFFTIYFIYKSFSEKKYNYSILIGIFLALSYLTRTLAVALLGAFVLSYITLFIIKKDQRKQLINKFLVSIFFFVVLISPWMIRNFYLYEFNLKLFFGSYSGSVSTIINDFNLVNYIIRAFVYLGYIILASLIIFPLKFINSIDKKNINFYILFFSLLIATLIILVKHGKVVVFFDWFTGRYVGRYADILLPMIFIGGFMGAQKIKKLNKCLIFIFGFLLAIASLLTLHSLFPVNHLSLSWVGVLKYIFEFIFYGKTTYLVELFAGSLIFFAIFFLFLLVLLLFLEKKFSLNKLIPYLFIFLILMNLLNFSINYYDSKTNWYNEEQMQLGLWLSEYDSDKISNILFDEESCGQLTKEEQDGICGGKFNEKTIIGYWLNDNITIGNLSNLENYDYIISKRKLDLPLIKETENIYVYKIN